jgi:hypothetical protein
MRKILCYAVAVALAALAYGADSTTTAKKSTAKKAPSRAAAPATAKKAPSKAGTRSSTTARKTTRRAAPATTWRNRQLTPTPERYKEIQDALVAKGYLRSEDEGSGWNQASMDALKRFQGEQNIEASGKINSLSLIALGLGPKHDTNPTKAVESGPSQDR